ncbi:MAG TPA: phosphoglycolate phosphatase [Vitreimonas sp.]|jgi:phosphoglycolate phosphatase|nr:phosphoglycolate phosphatase [Vitreimonas sp.]
MTTGEFADATIVFDLDGTLVDTAPDILRALNQTLDIEGLPQVKLHAVRTFIGQGARVTLERALELHGVHYSSDKIDQLTRALVDFYRTDIANESKPFPGLEDALDQLAGLGAKFSVCTNKRTELSVQLLDALDLTQRFSAIVGADAVTNRKPHPEHYRASVERAGGVLRRSLMVGDTVADVASARAAGAPVAVVSFGYCDGGAETLGADLVIDRFSELTSACRRLLAAHPKTAG